MHKKTGSQQNSCLLIVKDSLKYNGVHFSLLKTLVAFPVAQLRVVKGIFVTGDRPFFFPREM